MSLNAYDDHGSFTAESKSRLNKTGFKEASLSGNLLNSSQRQFFESKQNLRSHVTLHTTESPSNRLHVKNVELQNVSEYDTHDKPPTTKCASTASLNLKFRQYHKSHMKLLRKQCPLISSEKPFKGENSIFCRSI